jgi:hypothetical protein
LAKFQRGNGEESEGGLYRLRRLQIGQEFMGIEERKKLPRWARLRHDFQTEVEDDLVLTCGTHKSVIERGKEIPVRVVGEGGPQAVTGAGPNRCPGPVSYFFHLFSSFIFLFSLFNPNFCI